MTQPLISVCVPTHHGRRDVLEQLLESVLAQASEVADMVEVCVSDNASGDGTEELVATARARTSCPVSYQRQSADVGMARNLLSVVELARGAYCWLLGSDDLLAPGALARACELISAMPGAAGYVVGSVYVDAQDPRLRSRQLPRAFHPPGDAARLVEGLNGVLDACGNAWTSISWNLVAREAWLRAARNNEALLLAHPVWPQIILLTAMARERPRWGWLAEPLVRQRNADPFVFEQGGIPLADRWSDLIGGQADAWAAVLGRGSGAWRRRMRRLHTVWGGVADARATKLYDDPSLRSQARLAATWLLAFWPVGDFWLRTLPATLMPVRLTRACWGPDAKRSSGRAPLTGGRDRLLLSARLPDRLRAGGVAWLQVTVRNAGARTAPSVGSRAVGLSQRWRTPDGQWVSWEALGTNELVSHPVSIPRPLRPGRALDVELALYAPSEPGDYRLEIAAHQHGVGWLDDVEVASALSRPVTIEP